MSGTQATSQIPAMCRGRGLNVTPWVLQVLLGFQFAMAGLAKVLGDPAMVEMFATIGQCRTYFTTGRAAEAMGPVWSFLDLTPLGRQETWEDSPEGYPQDPPYSWWRLRDEFESAIGEERS
jgi:predicted dithiol-disulfide oxidoreductase (DUF899 family)